MKRKRGARLGQHFLTGTWAARTLVEAAAVGQSDTVLEIGPGTGVLTTELLKAAGRVVAVEKDEALVTQLQRTFAKEIADGKLTVIEGDVRNIDLAASKLGEYSLAANIPYYITGEILRQFLSAQQQPRTMALLVQKEVAERVVARNKKESILSISVKVYGEPSIAAKVSKGNFSPPPSVDSAILVVKHISKEFFSSLDERDFFRIVRAGFSSKRKLLAGNLAKEFGRERAGEALSSAGLPEKVRAEDVPPESWKLLAQKLLH